MNLYNDHSSRSTKAAVGGVDSIRVKVMGRFTVGKKNSKAKKPIERLTGLLNRVNLMPIIRLDRTNLLQGLH